MKLKRKLLKLLIKWADQIAKRNIEGYADSCGICQNVNHPWIVCPKREFLALTKKTEKEVIRLQKINCHGCKRTIAEIETNKNEKDQLKKSQILCEYCRKENACTTKKK